MADEQYQQSEDDAEHDKIIKFVNRSQAVVFNANLRWKQRTLRKFRRSWKQYID